MKALWQFDQNAFRAIQNLRLTWLDPVLQAVTITGLGWVQVLLIATLFVDWRRLKPGTWSRHNLAFPLALAYAVTGVANSLVKHNLDRERPSNFSWVNSLEDIHFNSFSSGHTATSFGISVTLFWLTRGTDRHVWGKIGLIWALLVGFSRIYVGVHWPTDVVSGASVGLLCGTWLSWTFTRKPEPPSSAV